MEESDLEYADAVLWCCGPHLLYLHRKPLLVKKKILWGRFLSELVQVKKPNHFSLKYKEKPFGFEIV